MNSIYFCITISSIGLIAVVNLIYNIYGLPSSDDIKKIGIYIRKGSFAYLKREYIVLTPIVLAFSIILFLLFSWKFSLFFIFGAVLSVFSGFVGMSAATIANYKTTYAAKLSMNRAVYSSLSGGAIMGITTSSLGILGISAIYLICINMKIINPTNLIVAFSLGASFVALFARVGGGIFTKGADIGADLVGKTEARIPEDDPRNPAVIADNVGDNVGDVAGMGADLYESYIGAIYGCMALTFILSKEEIYINYIFYSLGIGLLASLITIFLSRFLINRVKNKSEIFVKNIGSFSSLLALIGIFILSKSLLNELNTYISIISGILCGVFIGMVTDYYTSSKPVLKVCKNSISGAATNILSGLSVGMKSTFPTLILICTAIFISFKISGIFGIGIAGLGMLLTLAATVSVDAYGPIADNAGGIAQMTHQDSLVRERTDVLDSIGNTTAAIGKGFSIGSAALTSLTLFKTFTSITPQNNLLLINSNVIIGLLLGGMLPFLFSSLTLDSVSNTANLMVTEVRRQFKEKIGILQGLAEPDYEKCVDISTIGAIKGMVMPVLVSVISPFIVFYTLGIEGSVGLLAGTLVSGVTLAVFMTNSGGIWDNAKKYIEKGEFGGKGSISHISSVIGDTVGDPLKDTVGPSLNILIKLISIISLIFIPMLI